MNSPHPPERVRGLVLSAGRTGTLYLAALLSRGHPGLQVTHEPTGSRRRYLAANLNTYLGWELSAIAADFNMSFRQSLALHGKYVEINPFLCPFAHKLADHVADIDVVHLVRHPATWAPSLIQHGASGAFKYLIRVVPLHTPVVDHSLRKHFSMTYLQRILWRWAQFNRNISVLQTAARRYTLIRFEDLFSRSGENARGAMLRFSQGLSLPASPASGDSLPIATRNSSRSDDALRLEKWSRRDRDWARKELTGLCESFGYVMDEIPT